MFREDLVNKIDGESSCKGKQKYSEGSATTAAERMAQKKSEPFEAYKCRHCEGWHVGHPRFWGWAEKPGDENLVQIVIDHDAIVEALCAAGNLIEDDLTKPQGAARFREVLAKVDHVLKQLGNNRSPEVTP